MVAAGSAVTHVTAGDRVLLLGRENWVQRKRVSGEELVRLPPADVLQLAMLKINPATALLLLRSHGQLEPGEWVLQNAANSGVGQCLIRLAPDLGLRTVNVVRSGDLVQPLLQFGADAVVVDVEDDERFQAEVAESCGGARIRLALDAVAGEMSNRLAASLAEQGTLVSYGLLSGRPCQVSPQQLIFRGITLTGFWLVKHLARMDRVELEQMYNWLGGKIAAGELRVAVERTYPIDDIKAALRHAAMERRGGKILVVPN